MLTAKIIAALLNIDPDTVHLWRRRGLKVQKKSRTCVVRLKAVRKGGRYFIPPQCLATFLRETGFSQEDWPDALLRILPLRE